MTLRDIRVGKSCRVVAVGGAGALRRRLLDMGVTPRTVVTVKKVAPMGDPIELLLRGYTLTLRLDDAEKISVEDMGASAANASAAYASAASASAAYASAANVATAASAAAAANVATAASAAANAATAASAAAAAEGVEGALSV